MIFEPIAIVGRSCLFPGALTPEELWRNIAAGRDTTASSPDGRWRVPKNLVISPDAAPGFTPTDRGGYVTGFDRVFQPDGFALPWPQLAPLDVSAHWVLHTAREALRDAGLRLDQVPHNAGLVLGQLALPTESFAEYAESVWLRTDRPEQAANRFHPGLSTELIARALGLRPDAFALDAACASSLYAIQLACDQLQQGARDLMLAGAVSRADDLFLHLGFSSLRAISLTGQSRPFHAHADGLLPAEGAGIVALKRLADARRAGDRIYAVIRGIGLSNDGRTAGLLTPSAEGQERAIRSAYLQAGLEPSQISLLECHATGTPIGDATEIRSTGRVFQSASAVPIGSVKSNLGHPLTAAGMAGLVKLMGAMAAATRPQTLHLTRDALLPDLASSPFRLLTANEPWESRGPRIAALNGFGFGGNNAHLLLEEWTGQDHRHAPIPQPETPRVAITAIGITAGSTRGVEQFTHDLFFSSRSSRRIDQISLRYDTLGFPPNDLRLGLPQQSLALEAAAEAISSSGLRSLEIDPSRIGVFAGAECDPEAARVGLRTRRLSGRDNLAAESGIPNWSAAGVTGRLTNMVANRISSAHDFRGPSLVLAQEELSGFAALRLACRALRTHEIDAAVVGAVDLSCEPVHEAASRALRPDAPPPGDAAVFFVLQRFDQAPRVLAEVDPHDAASAVESFGDHQPLAASSQFGRPHAATGLLETAAAALCCAHGSLYPARPFISDGRRTAAIHITTTAGTEGLLTLASHPSQPPKPLLPSSTPRLIFCAAADRQSLKTALSGAWQSPPSEATGPLRLAIVAANEADWRRKRDRVLEILDSPAPTFSADGIHFREAPLSGELAFVFPGGASSYAGMGRTLLAAFPEISLHLLDNAPKTRPSLEWLYASPSKPAGPGDKLAGSIFLSQFHARLTRSLLQLQPSAAIGMSAGETSALLAFDIWREADTFFEEFIQSGVFSRYLAGRYEAVAGTPWESWGLLLPESDLHTLLRDEPSLRLLAIHAPGEYLIAGDSATCARAVARAGKAAAQPVDFPAVIHCPDLAPFADRWRQLHHRETWPVPSGLRIYGMATGRPYDVNRDSAADALTAQALTTLDYPRVIRQAWDDGVRIFLEHGARGSCTSWIRRILAGREHLAIALDSPITDSLTQTIDAVAQLAVAGVPLNLAAFLDRIAPATASGREEPTRFLLPAHAQPVALPAEQPPPFPAPEPVPPHVPELLPVAAGANPANLDLFRRHAEQLAAHQAEFSKVALAAHRKFLDASQRAFHQMFANGPSIQVLARVPPPHPPKPRDPAPQLPPVKPRPIVWDRQQLEITAAGRISTVFGKQFEALDTYAKICRLPMPPMLLVDRVTHIEGEPGSMGLGRITTETDVLPTSWYLLQQRIPAGLMIEAGQADMLLISWLGIDFHLRGERVYRMLGCQVTFHAPLAMPGETLRYEIRINGHARQGGIRLFFFEYDCYIGSRLVLSVRKGQAGFFSGKELATSTGVLWDPRTTPPAPNASGPDPALSAPRSYSAEQVRAAAQGHVFECFGKGFELAAAQQRPPVFANSDLLQFDTITELNFDGGPWRRGFVRAECAVKPLSFLFTSHFKDDPCLPGTVMLEGCYQLMAFYMMAMGLTLGRDGWRFEPLSSEELTVSCRGQVLPTSRHLISELFIDEFRDGEEPVLIADTLGIVDGQRAFHGHRLGLRLVRSHLLDTPTALPALPEPLPGQKPPASVNGVVLDEHAMLHTAWGLPSKAFGPPYARFDSSQRCPRLPGPPYLFMSRITSLTGEFGVEQAGCTVEAEYAVRPSDWYFSSNSHPEMPYSVLLEVALQPCGWLSCFTGIPIHRQDELFFRNLDGAASQLLPVPARDAIITTRATLRNLSKFGSITLVSFDVHLNLDGRLLLDLNTSFGFFSTADLLGQTGLPPTPEEAARFYEPSDFYCDLRPLPARYFQGPLRLASGRLLMIDEITGLWTAPDGSSGRLRARKNLHPADWFFKAHFYQDPVQPGSLGLEAIVQTLQFFAIHLGLGDLGPTPQFELQKESSWKYRGQATPRNGMVETEVVVHSIVRSNGRATLTAEGWLWVDGLRVYHLSKLSLVIRT